MSATNEPAQDHGGPGVIHERLRDVQHTLRWIALELGETNDRRTIDSVMSSVMGLHSDIGETIADFECGWAADLHDPYGAEVTS